MKKIITIMSVLVIFITLFSLTTFASEYDILNDYIDTKDNISGYDPIIDQADLFSDDEENALYKRIKDIHDKYEFDVTFITVSEVPNAGDLRYYFDWYEGLDPNRDGLVYGVNMDSANRGYATSTRNFGTYAFTTDALETVDSEVVSVLKDEEYFKAFNLYLDYTEKFVKLGRSGKYYESPMPIGAFVLVVIILPLILAIVISYAIVKYVFVAQMKTAVIQTKAKEFMKKDSLRLSVKTDYFSHQTQSKRYDPPSKSSSGGGSKSSGYGGSRGGSSGSF